MKERRRVNPNPKPNPNFMEGEGHDEVDGAEGAAGVDVSMDLKAVYPVLEKPLEGEVL